MLIAASAGSSALIVILAVLGNGELLDLFSVSIKSIAACFIDSITVDDTTDYRVDIDSCPVLLLIIISKILGFVLIDNIQPCA